MRAIVAANAATSPCCATEPASNATPAAALAAAVERKPPPIQSSRSVSRLRQKFGVRCKPHPLFLRRRKSTHVNLRTRARRQPAPRFPKPESAGDLPFWRMKPGLELAFEPLALPAEAEHASIWFSHWS